MRTELDSAKVVAEEAKSTWEKLRKERDYHKTHQTRVNEEKVQINQTIKNIKSSHEEIEEKIEEIKKKLLDTTKEKALLKLEKDKLQKKAKEIKDTIKANEKRVQEEIEAQHKRQKMDGNTATNQSALFAQSTLEKGVTRNTRMPEDAKPNPFLTQTYEPIATRLNCGTQI